MTSITRIINALEEGSEVRQELERFVATNRFVLKVTLDLNDELEITNFEEVLSSYGIENYGSDYHYYFTFKPDADIAAHLSNKQLRKELRKTLKSIMRNFVFEELPCSREGIGRYFTAALRESINGLRYNDKVRIGSDLYAVMEIMVNTKKMELPV